MRSQGRTASGTTAAQIAEHAGWRDQVIDHLGPAHDAVEVAVLLGIVRAKIHPGQGEPDLRTGSMSAVRPLMAAKSSALWRVRSGA